MRGQKAEVRKAVCGACGEMFETAHPRKRYCSTECAAEGLLRKAAEGNKRKRKEATEGRVSCPCCGQLWPGNRGRAPWTINDGTDA